MNFYCLLQILSIFIGAVEMSSPVPRFDLPSIVVQVLKIIDPLLNTFDPIEVACAMDSISLEQQYEDSKVYFLVWTKDENKSENLHFLRPYSEESLKASNLNGELPTFVFFHGYAHNAMAKWIRESKKEIFSTQDANIISICYEEVVANHTSDLGYTPAICNALKAAEYAAKVLNWLSEKTGIKGSDMHMIGHSLGAHVAGITAQNMLGLEVGQVGRITSLDPAGLGFSPLFHSRKYRINQSQAEFTDVIHTNGCENPDVCIGMEDKLGHAEFHPNGGVFQPGCSEDPNCSHDRVTDLFVESIKPSGKKFQSWPCNSWEEFKSGNCSKDCDQGCPIMGLRLPPSTRGVFYLSTNAESPFAKGKKQM